MKRRFAAADDAGLVGRLTGFCIRHRLLVATVWIAAIVLGTVASLRLSPLLTSGFSLPGTDSNTVKTVLVSDFGVRSDRAFVLIAKNEHPVVRVRSAAARASQLLPGGRIDRIQRLSLIHI